MWNTILTNYAIGKKQTVINGIWWNQSLKGKISYLCGWLTWTFQLRNPLQKREKRVKHPFYGYTQAGPGVINSLVERMKRKFNWEIQPEWIVFTPGVVPALHLAVRSLTHPGDEVIYRNQLIIHFSRLLPIAGVK